MLTTSDERDIRESERKAAMELYGASSVTDDRATKEFIYTDLEDLEPQKKSVLKKRATEDRKPLEEMDLKSIKGKDEKFSKTPKRSSDLIGVLSPNFSYHDTTKSTTSKYSIRFRDEVDNEEEEENRGHEEDEDEEEKSIIASKPNNTATNIFE